MLSDGVVDYIWSILSGPGKPLIDADARRYMRENSKFCYQICQITILDDVPEGLLSVVPLKVDSG